MTIFKLDDEMKGVLKSVGVTPEVLAIFDRDIEEISFSGAALARDRLEKEGIELPEKAVFILFKVIAATVGCSFLCFHEKNKKTND